MKKLFYNILDNEQAVILPELREFKNNFYLAGGTALSLWLGHRKSIDFDFFTQKSFSVEKLLEKLKNIFGDSYVDMIQGEKDTLSVLISRGSKKVKVSFFVHKYGLVENTLDFKDVKLASVLDIACMKMLSITTRSVIKDYVDLYFIFKKISLKEILMTLKNKYPKLDHNIVLKSLVYFDDIEDEPIIYMPGEKVYFSKVKLFLETTVRELLNKLL